MVTNYKKLWHLLLDRNMNKSDLQRQAGISWAAIGKLSRDENVSTEILCRICSNLQCEMSDIVEFTSSPGAEPVGVNTKREGK